VLRLAVVMVDDRAITETSSRIRPHTAPAIAAADVGKALAEIVATG